MKKHPLQRNARGFALVIALSLMAFIVLLLVSIATMVSVELDRSGLDRKKMLAEENARLGMLIAIGELQKHTGADQRTTARADINEDLISRGDASRLWVGAYSNAATADYSQKPSEVAAEIITFANDNGSQAQLRNWLISGNEGLDQVESAAVGLAFGPDDIVSNLTTAKATSMDITIANQPARLLVGPNSVGQSPVDYVAAPLIDVSDSNNVVTGAYAWWVSDDGAKATINLPMPDDEEDSAFAFVTSPRAAIELMDSVNTSENTTLESVDMLELNPVSSDSIYNPSDVKLQRLTTLTQLPMMNQNAEAQNRLSQLVDYRYHDLTSLSSGLLTDTYAGGLKQDLSALLATGATAPLDTDLLFKTESDSETPTDADFGVPTWGQLRSFAQTHAGTALTPRIPTETQAGISPVLTYISLGFQYVVAPNGVDIHLAIYPIVVLWNPYTSPIAATRYEVGFQRRYSSRAWLQLQEYDPSAGGDFPWKVKETRSLNRAGATRSGPGSTGSDNSYFRFVVDAEEIPPGKSIIYTLQGSESGKQYDASANSEPQNIMTEGFNPIGHTLLRSISQKSEDSDAYTEYRVAIDRYNSSTRTISGDNRYSYIASQNMREGELCAYLGEVVDTEPIGFDPTIDDKRWYQSFTRAYPGTPPGISSGSGLAQGPTPLSTVTGPVFAQTIKASFNNSRMRWLAQGNPRAFMVLRHPRRDGDSGDGIDSTTPGYVGTSSDDWPQFIIGNEEDASSGYSLDADGSGETVQATLFEFRPDSQPLLSIGQLQHANLGFANGHPAYAVGNSLADFRLASPSDVLYQANDNTTIPSALIRTYYDFSWNLNRALWDRYFISTVPNEGTGKHDDDEYSDIPSQLPNSRYVIGDDAVEIDLKDASLAAKHIRVNGSFNINSTSEQAWRAVLGGVNKLAYNPETGAVSVTRMKAALARFSKPTQSPNSVSESWQSYRQLDEEQIAQLAANIVEEIRNRGPFVSMADFVNRRLVDNPESVYSDGAAMDERLKGVLQAAIDHTTSGARATNSDSILHLEDTPNYTGNYYDINAMRGGPASVAPYSSKSAFAPQFLTQADILSAIGSTLSARSDTFTVRSYGEYKNPLDNTVESRVWCEAVVQRTYEYIDDRVPPETLPALAGSENQKFGRKYKIVSFKWLTPEEI